MRFDCSFQLVEEVGLFFAKFNYSSLSSVKFILRTNGVAKNDLFGFNNRLRDQ